jgi:hypothetical protein
MLHKGGRRRVLVNTYVAKVRRVLSLELIWSSDNIFNGRDEIVFASVETELAGAKTTL